MNMEHYQVTGMSCAACSARVEKAVRQVEGVSDCAVNLLTNSMTVNGTASSESIIQAVIQAGYGAALEGEKQADHAAPSQKIQDTETPLLKKRLIASLVFLPILMYIAMGHMVGLPLPDFLQQYPVANGLAQLLLAAIVMVINQRFFVRGFKGLLHRAPNMDTLVAMGSSASFLYSTCLLFVMVCNPASTHTAHDFYFDSSAMILTLITVGKMLEARSKGKTTDALQGLMKLMPEKALVVRNGVKAEIPADEVQKEDIFLLYPGQRVPVDGVILEGESSMDESAITGESMPVDKSEGMNVTSASINLSGFLKCRATRVGSDTTLSKIIQMVSDASATKAPIAKTADKVSGIFVPVVLSIAAITLIVWLLAGKDIGYALARSVSVLVISCPCALGLATPVAIMVGTGLGARNGILFKTAESLEVTGKTKIVVLDKTGTLTQGHPSVCGVYPQTGTSREELLQTAVSLESNSEHPLAKAIVDYGALQKTAVSAPRDFRAVPGGGVTGLLNGQSCRGGNLDFIRRIALVPQEAEDKAKQLSAEGKTPLFFSSGETYLGMIAASDLIKPDSAQAIQDLKSMNIRTVMLTGDNADTAKAMAKEAGIDEVIAGVKPDGKAETIRNLKEQGQVMMVGDGINDAPALTEAHIGMAIGAGTDIALDAADVVLMNSSLRDAVGAIRLSRATLRIIHQNLFWAFFYNIIGIPLAAGVWIPVFGLTLNPMIGAMAMSLSSFCVVSNALRLNLFKVHDAQTVDSNIQKKESRTMEKTLKVEGMMCCHCEAHVKKALEDLAGVTEAIASHEKGTVVVKLSTEVSDAVLKKAVEDAGYKVL